jgi:hypothetical protein
MSSASEWSKSYPSWDQAVDEAVDLLLLNRFESAAAKMMPPGFPFHGSANIDIAALTDQRLQVHQRTKAVGAFWR